MADFLFNISLPEGKDAASSLIWAGVLCLQRRGVASLNLGGGVLPGDKLAQAKQRFGASVLPLRCLKQVYDVDRFTELCQKAGADPSERGGYFPPYRKAGKL
jgi:hypothetical protein